MYKKVQQGGKQQQQAGRQVDIKKKQPGWLAGRQADRQTSQLS